MGWIWVIVCPRLISTEADPEHNAASPEQMKNDFFQAGRGPTQSRNRCFMHQSQTLFSNSSLVNRTRRKMLPSCVQISLIAKLLCGEHFTYHSHDVPLTQQSRDMTCDRKHGGWGMPIISSMSVAGCSHCIGLIRALQLELIMAKKWHACRHLSTDTYQHVIIKEGSRCSPRKHVNLHAFSDSHPPSVPLTTGLILSGKLSQRWIITLRCEQRDLQHAGGCWLLFNMNKSSRVVAGNFWRAAFVLSLFLSVLLRARILIYLVNMSIIGQQMDSKSCCRSGQRWKLINFEDTNCWFTCRSCKLS